MTIKQLHIIFVESHLKTLAKTYNKNSLYTQRATITAFHRWVSKQYGIPDIIPRKLPKPKPKPKPKPRPQPKPKPLPVLKAPDGTNAIAEWLEYCQRYTTSTQEYYRTGITSFVKYLDIENIDQLNCRTTEKYISFMLSKGYKHSTANRSLNIIKSFFCWLSRNYQTPNYGNGIQKLREDPPERRVLTWEEYEKILDVCSEKEADIIRFLMNVGLRASEFVKIKWGDVSPDYKMLTVIGKGRKKRYVSLNDVCIEILKKYERGQDNMLLDFIRRCTSRKTLYYTCVKLAKKAGIPRAGPHSYRHGFATTLLISGIPISHVSKLLGHSSIAITEKTYIHWTPNYLNGATDVLVNRKM